MTIRNNDIRNNAPVPFPHTFFLMNRISSILPVAKPSEPEADEEQKRPEVDGLEAQEGILQILDRLEEVTDTLITR